MTLMFRLLILLQFLLLINFCKSISLSENDCISIRQQIEQYLTNKNNNNNIYNFDNFKYTDLQRDNLILVETDLKVCPTNESNQDQCTKTDNCKATFAYNAETNQYSLIANSINCNPKQTPSNYCAGCPFDLNTNVSGISTFVDAALAHFRTEYELNDNSIEVERFQRQILETQPRGVKYFLYLLVEQCSTDNPTAKYCLVIFLQQPRLDNTRKIIANNCTDSQQFLYVVNPVNDNKNNENNEIEINYTIVQPPVVENEFTSKVEYDKLAQNGNVEDMLTASRIENINSQVEPLNDAQKAAANGLMDIFEFNEPKFQSNTQMQLNSERKPIVEPLIVPVKAVARFKRPLAHDHVRAKRSVDKLVPTDADEYQFVRNLAELAVNTLDQIDTDEHKRVVLKLLSSKKQSIDDNGGTAYYLTLKVGVSECTEQMLPPDDVFKHQKQTVLERKCHQTLIDDLTKICEVQIRTGAKSTKPKVVQSKCQNLKRIGERNNRTGRSVGGRTPINSNHEVIARIGEMALNKLDEISDEAKHWKIINFINGTEQVVAGKSYEINIEIGLSQLDKSKSISTYQERVDSPLIDEYKPQHCRITMWERLWLKHCEITVKCDRVDELKFVPDNPVLPKRVKRHQGPVHVGKIMDISEDHEAVTRILTLALNKMDELSENELTRWKLIKFVSGSTQPVAGKLFIIKYTAGLSNLNKLNELNSYQERVNAELLPSSKTQQCTVKMWERQWLNKAEIVLECDHLEKIAFDIEMGNQRHTRSVIALGAPKQMDLNDPKIDKIANAALTKLDSDNNEQQLLKIVHIVSATKQLVAGVLYKLIVDIGFTNLNKSIVYSYDTRKSSDLRTNPDIRRCKISFWQHPKLTTDLENNLTIDCNNTNLIRQRRSTLLDDVDTKQFRQFTKFLVEHKREYAYSELIKRYEIFKQNMIIVDQLNKYEQGTAKYGPTIFADWSRDEFKKLLGYKPALRQDNELPFVMAETPNIDLPAAFDWRDNNAVTHVKNQGMCGSCWAFSVTGNVEGQYAIKTGKLVEFSEQELVDCDKVDEGCNGGLMDNAYRQIEELGGLETEGDYPYDAHREKCHMDHNKIRVQLKGAVNITQNETGMAKWLVANGPISIAINANAMQFYMGGVSHPWKALCNPKQLDHGVLIVGYGVYTNHYFNKTKPYWIVKNSWGPRWGEKGYYRVYRGDGTCGVNQTPSSAIIKI